MTGFHEVRFPDAIARGAMGGPGYDTTIITTVAGFERRNANWAIPRGRWDVGSGLRRRADLEALIAFFRARQGRAYGFRFKDWTDFATLAEPLGVGDGVTTVFQLVRGYLSGPTSVSRIITKPVDGTVRIYSDGVLVTSGVSVDHATGRVTFAAAPAEGLLVSADFEFDVPARFERDTMALSLDTYQTGSWDQIGIMEIRA